MEGQKLIDKFNKNSVEIVKVSIQEYKGKEYVDLRVWAFEKPDGSGEEKPTRKGITLNTGLLPKLIEALEKAQEEMAKNLHERPQERRSPEGKATT